MCVGCPMPHLMDNILHRISRSSLLMNFQFSYYSKYPVAVQRDNTVIPTQIPKILDTVVDQQALAGAKGATNPT